MIAACNRGRDASPSNYDEISLWSGGSAMGLAVEIIGLVVFLGAHVFVSMRERRAALIASIGGVRIWFVHAGICYRSCF